ncbi:MAG: Y-family DNA polymerase [Rikenellaceae bacterium]
MGRGAIYHKEDDLGDMIGLCDCNNFYVSCERLFDPRLEGRPVVVMSSNDGCVIARSNEAKALGIKMSQPMFQIRDLVARYGVVAKSGNLQLYGDISERVMMTLRAEVPSIEIYSIDEAFLDLSQIEASDVTPFAQALARRVRRNVGVPVSIGVAPSKTLAKVASKLCKSYPKLNGACLMHRAEDVAKVLSSYPVGEVWGIGRRSVAMLSEYNIRTAEEFRAAPREWVRAKMGVVGERTWRELWGESCIEIDLAPSERQSIMVSRSFHADIDEIEPLGRSVADFASRATEKLRVQGSVASQMQVFLMTNRHRDDQPQHSEGRMVNFSTPTDSTLEIVKAATQALKQLYRVGYRYKKAGVVLYEISSNSGVQCSMFDEVDRTKHRVLMETMDRLNSQMGRTTIKVGSQGEGAAHSSSENRSPNYTTAWSDILNIKV